MRRLEWGVRSYHDYALGLTLVLLALVAAVVRPADVHQGVAWLMCLSGVASLAQGWVVGARGFSSAHATLILVAWALSLAWMIWLAIGTRHTLPDGEAGRTPRPDN